MSSMTQHGTDDANTPILKILCFGDSLTAGYSQWGMQHYPYGVHLKDHLRAAFPNTRIVVDVEGMSGAQVRGQYTRRLNRVCMKAQDEPYDWIIIMGGTNDLGWGGQPQQILEALRGSSSLPCRFPCVLARKTAFSVMLAINSV